MKSVVRPALVNKRLLVVGSLIIVVAQFMMDHHEVLIVYFNAHLDAQIFLIIDVPRGRMTHHFAIARFRELRPLPKCFRQGRQAKRGIETFACLHHLYGIIALPQ